MKQHIISLPHHPKRVIVISLIVATAIGIFGYIKINEKPTNLPSIKNIQTTDISSSRNLTLGFLAGGRIKSVFVKAGDIVKKGQVLATLDAGNTLGALASAKAVYKDSEANYQKIMSGAANSAILVAKAAVNTAQVNLDGIIKQQNTLVANAHTNLLNSTFSANLQNGDNSSITAPFISGTYVKGAEGNIIFTINQAGNSSYLTFSGIENGTSLVSTTTPQAIGDTGLYIEFISVSPYIGTTWVINIPNKTAEDYLSNYNAYQSALEAQSQTVGNAQASLDQAKASMVALTTSARPEDVAMAQAQMDNAQGAVLIAQATYENTIITAPNDGTVVSISITPGQIATPNAPAIEFVSN